MGEKPKFIALKRIFKLVNPDLVLIQESMCLSQKVVEFFIRLFPGGKVSATGATGLSWDLLVAWNPLVWNLKPFFTYASIILEGRIRGLDAHFHVLNYYGPYLNREVFWNYVESNDILQLPNLIMGADLNLTMDA